MRIERLGFELSVSEIVLYWNFAVRELYGFIVTDE